ncbi:MAG: hypothetical protein AAFZ15_25475 [Bacteroidota bacterium]
MSKKIKSDFGTNKYRARIVKITKVTEFPNKPFSIDKNLRVRIHFSFPSDPPNDAIRVDCFVKSIVSSGTVSLNPLSHTFSSDGYYTYDFDLSSLGISIDGKTLDFRFEDNDQLNGVVIQLLEADPPGTNNYPFANRVTIEEAFLPRENM